MKQTPQKLKKPRKGPKPSLKLCKRKRRNLAPNFLFARPRRTTLPDLVVRPVLLLLLVVIFVPKVDSPKTFSEAPICVFGAERMVTGPVLVPPKIKSRCQDQNHDFSVLDHCEFDQSEQGVEDPSCIQGKLRANFPFWRDAVRASAIQSLYLTFIENVTKFFFGNRPYRFRLRIDVLLCIREVLFMERSQSC